MSEDSQTQWLLPTYQAPLIKAIETVVDRFMEGSNFLAWESLKTLYAILPSDVRDIVKAEYEQIQRQIQISFRRRRNPDSLIEQSNCENALAQILSEHNHAFLTHTIDALFDKGYLKKPTGPRTKQTGLGRLEELQT